MDIVGLRLHHHVFFIHKKQKNARRTAGYTGYADSSLASDRPRLLDNN